MLPLFVPFNILLSVVCRGFRVNVMYISELWTTGCPVGTLAGLGRVRSELIWRFRRID